MSKKMIVESKGVIERGMLNHNAKEAERGVLRIISTPEAGEGGKLPDSKENEDD